eukprot:scaffold5213_cov113-Isochrysis_galbana.AAC.12
MHRGRWYAYALLVLAGRVCSFPCHFLTAGDGRSGCARHAAAVPAPVRTRAGDGVHIEPSARPAVFEWAAARALFAIHRRSQGTVSTRGIGPRPRSTRL